MKREATLHKVEVQRLQDERYALLEYAYRLEALLRADTSPPPDLLAHVLSTRPVFPTRVGFFEPW